MPNLTGMIDAVIDAGADNTGATDTATALSNAVAMCFGFGTMAELDAAKPPATHVRQPSQWLYIPPGFYQLQSSLALQSIYGLTIRGGGSDITLLACQGGRPESPLLATLDLNGIASCVFSDFTVGVAAPGDVRALIYLHWDPGRACRSTSLNSFYNVAATASNLNAFFREAAWQLGTLPGDGPPNYQCDQTQLFNVRAGGNYPMVRGDRTMVGGFMKKDLYYQCGFRFGDGGYGNNGWHQAHSLWSVQCRYGVDWWAADCPIYGGLIQSNDVDLYASAPPASYITVKNIRSEASGRFFATSGGGGNPNAFHASLEDCAWTIPGGNDAVRGALTTATANTIIDTSQQWHPNEWVGYIARITRGPQAGHERRITMNTSNQLTLASDWDTIPHCTNRYSITPAATGGTITSLEKTGAQWKANQWRGYYIYLLSGPGKGQVGWVDSNTTDTLTIDNNYADVPLGLWAKAPDTDTAFALALIPPDGEFVQWNFAGVFRISGLEAYGPINSLLGIHHKIGLHPAVRQCTALIDGASIGETTRAQAFEGASPLAAIDVRGWESVEDGGQLEQESETGQILINSGQAVDVKTVAASTTLDKGHDHVRVDATAGPVTIILPDATRFAGRRFTVKKIDGSTNAVIIQGQKEQTIDNLASMSSTNRMAVFRLYSTGANWETD